ncbi:hypothetical protein [Endozoicomonas sp. GU-1]|uniref:hypothetical protein n=1 Tax=Endozoicomonas sp. GU-1 TaxID=3009078 RepID=UPI0022B3D7FF|nr:hypothetical protein [Endozoicomonas sp. GU-1]WBA86510.1 hypothetical protein O3276_00165 [Endozoicomonas sp. GU-1]
MTKIDLSKPGTALVMKRTDKTFHRISVPCFDPLLDLDARDDRLNEAVEILSLLIAVTESIKPGNCTDEAMAGAATMLRRAINLISGDIQEVPSPFDESPSEDLVACKSEIA